MRCRTWGPIDDSLPQVGRVLSVEELTTSDKLFKVRVLVSNGGEPEERQVCNES